MLVEEKKEILTIYYEIPKYMESLFFLEINQLIIRVFLKNTYFDTNMELFYPIH